MTDIICQKHPLRCALYKRFQKLFPKFKRNTCDMPILSAVLNLALQLDLKKTL